jgi:hypothetical protein
LLRWIRWAKRIEPVRIPHLSDARDSLYFWPILTLSAIAVFFFGWAVQISAENWVGQVVWGGLSTLIALVLVAMAVRDSHRTSLSRVSARRLVGRAPR